MKALFAALLLALAGSPWLHEACAAPDLFVAPNGDDANPGTLEKPLATLDRARSVVRDLKSRIHRDGPIVVAVRGGTYFLKEPLVFTSEDSGSEAMPVVYQAFEDERPLISGGQLIGDWQETSGAWKTRLPDAVDGRWSFTRLFVNGQSCYRPRLPKQGYYFVRAEIEPTETNKKKGFDRFGFAPGDIKAGWRNLGDVEMLGMQIWSMARMRVASVDEEGGIVNFAGVTSGTASYQKFPRGGRYLIENVKEAAEPGDFYLDSKTGELTCWPAKEERPLEVIAPRLERLVEFRGDIEKRSWVQHITFRGLHFAHSNWQTPPQGYSAIQAEVPLGAAISAAGARNVTIENCTVSQTGEYAIALNEGCKSNRIVGCDLVDLGAGGVKIGTTKAFDDDEQVASHNVIRDCLIAHGGRLHPAAVGVLIGHSPFNKIEHNEIVDFYYSGISLGWSWGYGRSLSHDNEIGFNRIHQIGQGVLSDMGGIYTLGAGGGNHLHHNLIHDVDSFSYGGWGIYFDEGTSDALAENNVVYRTKSAGFHQHYGKNNTVRNNVFAFGGEAQIMRGRPEPDHFTCRVGRNIVVWKNAPLLGGNWSGDNFQFDSNLYWRTDDQPVTFPGDRSFEQWQAGGQDKNSRIADPLFVDVKSDDYRLRSESPAIPLGFQAIDVSTAGRSASTMPAKTQTRRFPPPPPKQP